VDLPFDFRELLAELARDGVEHVLVGGYAVAFHGRPRASLRVNCLEDLITNKRRWPPSGAHRR